MIFTRRPAPTGAPADFALPPRPGYERFFTGFNHCAVAERCEQPAQRRRFNPRDSR
jgi:hypothetical protein